MKKLNNFRITGEFTTLSPLSHIGEAISTTTYLIEEPVLQGNGQIENVFVYNGNAWRGQLRDLAATYLLTKLGITVGIDAFHLLFSGGKIGGDQTIDISKARNMRRVVPMISLFGGGIGNQILPGKMRVGSSYPVCREAMRVLPDHLAGQALKASYRHMTMEKSYTRMDDSKDPRMNEAVNPLDVPLLESSKSKKKEGGEVSTQMRMTSELLIAGVTLHHQIDLIDVDMIEVGVLAAALHAFGANAYIGGQGNRGHGKVSYVSKIINMDTGEENDFIKITGEATPKLSRVATEAKSAYDELLREQYDSFLQNNKSEISGLLG